MINLFDKNGNFMGIPNMGIMSTLKSVWNNCPDIGLERLWNSIFGSNVSTQEETSSMDSREVRNISTDSNASNSITIEETLPSLRSSFADDSAITNHVPFNDNVEPLLHLPVNEHRIVRIVTFSLPLTEEERVFSNTESSISDGIGTTPEEFEPIDERAEDPNVLIGEKTPIEESSSKKASSSRSMFKAAALATALVAGVLAVRNPETTKEVLKTITDAGKETARNAGEMSRTVMANTPAMLEAAKTVAQQTVKAVSDFRK